MTDYFSSLIAFIKFMLTDLELQQQSIAERCKKRSRTVIRATRIATACIVCTVAAILMGYWFLTNRVNSLTSERRVPLPRMNVSAKQISAIETKLNSISEPEILDENRQREIELTADEINTLIHKEPRLREAIFVRFEDQQIKADVSLPADSLPGGEGRFFNAEVTFEVDVIDGALSLTVSQASIDGSPISSMWIDQVKQRNFAQPLYNDRQISKILENVTEVEIDDNVLRLFVGSATNAEQTAMLAHKENPKMKVR